MAAPNLVVEHRQSANTRKRLRVKASHDLFVIGSSSEADLRIFGEGVTGCHAALRLRDGKWFVCNLSGTDTVRVNGELSNEAVILGDSKIEIAGHSLRVALGAVKPKVFATSEIPAGQSSADPTASGANSRTPLHQIVVFRHGRVIETCILKENEEFVYFNGETNATLPAPKTRDWVKTNVGVRRIEQRLVSAQEIAAAEQISIDRDLRRAIFLAAVIFILLLGTVLFLGRGVDKKPLEVTLDKKSLDMIFNAKTIKKKRAESEKVIVKAAKAQAGGSNEAVATQPVNQAKQPEESVAPQVNPKAQAALTSLRKAGLGNLIGKIAKRANQQSLMVAASGTSPDKESGRALYSVGTSTVGGGGQAVKAGSTIRLGGIATAGKGGGVSNVKGGTALAGGNVGAGNVLALSDDEETVIEGGLDKDVIAEVIKRNIGQIRYCYERQLSSNPDLYGKVLVRWTISAVGDVGDPRVDTSTLKNAMVEGCILRRLASWKFPTPKGGTVVRVSYPFLFKAQD